MTASESWDAVHRDREWGMEPLEHLVRFVKRNYPDGGAGLTALDLGCGAGAQTCFLARMGFGTSGIDSSHEAINRCVKHAWDKSFAGTVGFQVADVCTVPIKDGFFDLVVDTACLQHVTDADLGKAMREVHRVLKPGGRFFSYALRVGTSQSVRERMPVRVLHRYDIGHKYETTGMITESVDAAEFTEGNGTIIVRHWIIVGRKVAT